VRLLWPSSVRSQLGLKQIDLVLIHAPYHGYAEPYSNCSKGPAGAAARQATWRGMEKAVKDGLTRAIGLSNFDVEYMSEIMDGAEIPPAVNQVGPCSLSLWHTHTCLALLCPALSCFVLHLNLCDACSAVCVSATSRTPLSPSRSTTASHTKQYALSMPVLTAPRLLRRVLASTNSAAAASRVCMCVCVLQYSPLGGKDIGGTSVLDYPQLKGIAKAVRTNKCSAAQSTPPHPRTTDQRCCCLTCQCD
jgi:hypothetical protein